MSSDLLCVASTDGYLKDINPSFAATLGHTAGELRSRPYLDLIHPDDRTAAMAELKRLKDGGGPHQFRRRFRHKSGRHVWLDWSATQDGDEVFGVARDVTAEVHAERRAEAAAARLQDQQQQLREFARIVAHDLRAPLRHALASPDQIPATTRQTLEDLDTMMERLAHYERVLLVDNDDETTDLDEAWDDAASHFQQVDAETRFEPTRPLGRVAGSFDHWVAVFRNLIENSIVHNRPGTAAQIQIMSVHGPDKVTLHYRDTGPGISADQVSSLWQPFLGAQNPAHGLGLALVRRIIRRSGGDIRLDPGRPGVHFIINAAPAPDISTALITEASR